VQDFGGWQDDHTEKDLCNLNFGSAGAERLAGVLGPLDHLDLYFVKRKPTKI
jgi:hypothetical protein